MNITINFVFTPEAADHLKQMGQTSATWPSPDIGTTPLQGDLISFSDKNDAPIFEVRNRLFIWRTPTDLVIQPLLAPLSAEQPDQA